MKTTGSMGNAAATASVMRVGLSMGTTPISLTTEKLPPRSAKEDASGFPRIVSSDSVPFSLARFFPDRP
jgi:hypothetical protein